MKKLAIVLFLCSFLISAAVPVFSQCLRFDFDGDGQGDDDWGIAPGETVLVDVWLDLYTSENDVSSVLYGFDWDPASITVTSAFPYDTENGGPWAGGYAHLEYNGGYWYRVVTANLVTGIPVDTRIKLHTIELYYSGGVSRIETYKVSDFEGVSVTPSGTTELFTLTHASALIHPPSDCRITMDPGEATVFTGESVQFSAGVSGDFCRLPCYTWEVVTEPGTTGSSIDINGLYVAGDTPRTDQVTVTDGCNGDVSASASVQVSAPSTTTTTTITTTTTTVSATTTSIPNLPTTTTSIIPLGDPCTADESCNDGVFCNGVEICAYSESSGTDVCQTGDNPCPNDGLYCNGEESCHEEGSTCLLTGDPCAAEGLVCDEESDVCSEACSEAADCDDGIFCNGEEVCEGGICLNGDGPCSPDEACDEETDQCKPPDLPLSFKIIPHAAFRSQVIPLPLIMFIRSTDDLTTFDQETTTVSFDDEAIVNDLITLVVSKRLIYLFALVRPAGFSSGQGWQELTVKVTTAEGLGTAPFTLLARPIILDGMNQ